MENKNLEKLETFLKRIPAITFINSKIESPTFWWIKLGVDIESPIAWNVVQELDFVLNYISIEERLPTVFKPVSPPPYLNGGPKQFLSWVIEPMNDDVDPDWIADVLEERLPSPVDNITEWQEEEET